MDLANVVDRINFDTTRLKVDGVEFDPVQLTYGISSAFAYATFALESDYLTADNIDEKYEAITRCAIETMLKRDVVKDA